MAATRADRFTDLRDRAVVILLHVPVADLSATAPAQVHPGHLIVHRPASRSPLARRRRTCPGHRPSPSRDGESADQPGRPLWMFSSTPRICETSRLFPCPAYYPGTCCTKALVTALSGHGERPVLSAMPGHRWAARLTIRAAAGIDQAVTADWRAACNRPGRPASGKIGLAMPSAWWPRDRSFQIARTVLRAIRHFTT